MEQAVTRSLLDVTDPPPVELVNADSTSSIFLLCEHAGRAVPTALDDLGVAYEVIKSHRGWDIGAENLARALAEHLNAPLVIQRYSRLVIDCNRPHDSALLVPTASDGVAIPGNHSISPAERIARLEEIFLPMNVAINDLILGRKAAFSVHSFTRELAAAHRPWHAGFLSRTDHATAHALCSHVAQDRPDLNLAVNEPYQIETNGDWFIPTYAEPLGLKHSLIEVRNDQLEDEAGVAIWASLLADAIASVVDAS